MAVATIALTVAACSGQNNEHHDDHDHSHTHGVGDAGTADAEHDHDAHSHGADMAHDVPDVGDVGVVVTQDVKDYCECLLITCHDDFHAKYGADDVDAIAACQQEGAGFPVAGSEQMSGNSIECRIYHCGNVDDGSSCEDALGAACM